MKRALLIAEKPSLMRDIQSAYKKIEHTLPFKIDFQALRGYFVGLKDPVDYNSDWGKPWNLDVLPMVPSKFDFEVTKGIERDFQALKSMVHDPSYDFVINACDAGREGQSIFWSFYETAKGKLPVERLWVSDTTEEAFIKGLNNLISEDTDKTLKNIKDASFYRMQIDWLLGMNLSRAITLKTGKLIPVGRVMSPTLNIVVQRDLEILNFVPKTTYEVEGDFTKYKGIWFDKEGNTRFDDKDKAEKFIKGLGKKGTISELDTKRELRQAPPNYSLGDLQRDANNIYGFTARETLNLAQSLYETHKILSYPRTESKALSTSLAKEIDKYLQAIENVPAVESYVKDILSDKKRIEKTRKSKRYINDAKLTDHHAIIPTKRKPNLANLSDKEKKLYLLVVKRFVSIFLDPQEIDRTTIITDVEFDGKEVEQFKTTGSVIVKPGYTVLYGKGRADDEIPAVKKGEVLDVKEFKLSEKISTPPPYYNDSTLLGAMINAGRFVEEEELKDILKDTAGLGTVATRDSIIEKLISVKMFERKGKSIRATDFGFKVIEALDGREIISPDLTAQWEQKLRQIEEGSYKSSAFKTEMDEYVIKQTNDFINAKFEKMADSTREELGTCPKCKGTVYITDKYYLCQNYKSEKGTVCDFIMGKKVNGATLNKTEAKKLLEGKETKQLNFKNKAGKPFTTSLIYNKEEGRVSFNFKTEEATNEVLGKCPTCQSNVIDRGSYSSCEKEGCKFSISYTILGAKLTKTDIKNILNGKPSGTKTFTWKSGKKGKAQVELKDNKMNFIFK